METEVDTRLTTEHDEMKVKWQTDLQQDCWPVEIVECLDVFCSMEMGHW